MFYYHQTQLKTIQYPSYTISRIVIFFGFLFSFVPNFREHIIFARTSILELLKKNHSTYLQDNEKIEQCGVARAFVQKNGPRSKKFGHPCIIVMIILIEIFIIVMRKSS